VDKIFYYGTGVSSEKNQEAVKNVFLEFFPSASIEVGWDLLAAARALCGREPGIACILGTGSNSCFYDGEKITGNVANLGWILADEGSGTYIGKQFIKDYFRGVMPEALAKQFHARYPWTREEVLEKVYQQEKPSAFLASFAKFIFQHLKDPVLLQTDLSKFFGFLRKQCDALSGLHSLQSSFYRLHCFYFSDVLRQVAMDKGIAVKNILEGPIAGLTLYHQKDLN
jgi:Predicted N-acetylglucosamine kinase